MEPAEGDFVRDGFADYRAANPETYFDTWIGLERALTIVDPADIESNIGSTEWLRFGNNDDSSELPEQPSGNRYNSLLRVTAGDEPLVRGLYRIAFTTYRASPVEGTFVAQVGAPIELPGVVLAPDIDSLLAAIEAAE